MAFIEIIQLPSGKASCSGYAYANDRKIVPGEVAFVPDDVVKKHLATRLVMTVPESEALGRLVNDEDFESGYVEQMRAELEYQPPKRGRRKKVDAEAAAVNVRNAQIREEAAH